MARPIRVQFAGAVYHLTARGNERRPIFRDDHDRRRFLETLEDARHLVEEDVYARELVKYIHLNPVRPRDKGKAVPPERKRDLAAYRWSSHRAYAGLERIAVFPGLCLDWLSYFGGRRGAAQAEYRRQIEQMFGQVVRSPWEGLRQGLVLGGEALWSKARELLSHREGQEEIRWQRRAEADDRSRVIASLVEREHDRRVAIWLRVRMGGERMTAVGKEYGYRDGSGVHQVVKRLEKKAQRDRSLSARLGALADEVSRVKS